MHRGEDDVWTHNAERLPCVLLLRDSRLLPAISRATVPVGPAEPPGVVRESVSAPLPKPSPPQPNPGGPNLTLADNNSTVLQTKRTPRT